MSRGRPSTYKPEYCQQVKEMLIAGKTIKHCVAHFGMGRTAFYEWVQKYPDLANTINEFKDDCEVWWLNKGMDNLDNKQFNSHLYALMMQNMFNWNRKVETSGTVTVRHEDALKELE